MTSPIGAAPRDWQVRRQIGINTAWTERFNINWVIRNGITKNTVLEKVIVVGSSDCCASHPRSPRLLRCSKDHFPGRALLRRGSAFPTGSLTVLFSDLQPEHCHEDASRECDPPGRNVKLCGEDQTEHGDDEDHDSDPVNGRR